MRMIRGWSLLVCTMFLMTAMASVAPAQQRPTRKAPAAPANNAAAPAKKPGAPAATAPNPNPKPVDLKFISPGALTAWFVHPQQLLASPSFQAMPIEVIEAVAKQEAGIDIYAIEEVVFLMSFNPAQQPPALPAWIVRFNKPCDKVALTERLSTGAGPKIGDFDSHQVKNADPLLMIFPDDRTLLAGSEGDLTGMLSGKKASSPLIDRLITIDRGELLSGVVVIDPIRPLAKMALTQLQQLPPDFQQFAEVADLLAAVELHVRSVEAGTETSLVLAGTSQGAAARLDQLLDNAIALATAAIDAQLAQASANDPGPVNEALGRYVRRMLKTAIDAVHREQAHNRLTLRMEGGNDASVGLATNGVLVALLLPAVQAAREAARRSQSNNNLKQIGLAMQNYADVNRSFPARAIFHDGKPLLSWRVAILPYVEQKALYDQFHRDEPWDSEHNRKLIEMMPPVYVNSKLDTKLAKSGKTSYLAPTGSGTLFDGEKQPNFLSITDGTSNTIMVVEANADRAVIWTKPDDLEIDPVKPLDGLGDIHPGGFLAVFADGHTSFIQKAIDPQMLLNLFNPRDGQAVRVD